MWRTSRRRRRWRAPCDRYAPPRRLHGVRFATARRSQLDLTRAQSRRKTLREELALATTGALLDITGPSIAFPTEQGATEVVHGLDLTISAGETLAVVGESGSGKSVTALAITP